MIQNPTVSTPSLPTLPRVYPQKSCLFNRVRLLGEGRMFPSSAFSYSNRSIYRQIINGPITHYLVLFIKAEPQFIKVRAKINALIVHMMHSRFSQIRMQSQRAWEKKELQTALSCIQWRMEPIRGQCSLRFQSTQESLHLRRTLCPHQGHKALAFTCIWAGRNSLGVKLSQVPWPVPLQTKVK